MELFEIGADGIRLGQLLKVLDLVESGGAVKELLAGDDVVVNGRPEHRRGAQLHPGDVVIVEGRKFRLS